MGTKRKNDGLDKFERYRLKDLDGYRKKKREWARSPDQKEKRVSYMRKWRAKNRERHNELARQSHARNRHKHIQKVREYHLIRQYGITQSDYDAMCERQNNTCAICKEASTGARKMHVDHCHKTGRVRGILCHRCNTKLGWLEMYQSSIVEYLKYDR